MNANELADNWQKKNPHWDERELYAWGDEAATMLRAQQAEIEQLEKTQDYLYKEHDKDKEKRAFQQAEIEVLKFDIEGYVSANTEMLSELEALKAHPVKELTDEEIEEVAESMNWCGNNWKWDLDFAKAILKKANKK